MHVAIVEHPPFATVAICSSVDWMKMMSTPEKLERQNHLVLVHVQLLKIRIRAKSQGSS
jgi:hypothetical protein